MGVETKIMASLLTVYAPEVSLCLLLALLIPASVSRRVGTHRVRSEEALHLSSNNSSFSQQPLKKIRGTATNILLYPSRLCAGDKVIEAQEVR